MTQIVSFVAFAAEPRGAGKNHLAYGDVESVLHLDSGDASPKTGFVDSAAGFAYFAFSRHPDAGPATLVKIRTSDLTRVATLELAPDESWIGSGAIDLIHGYAYLGTTDAPGRVIQIRLSDFTRVGSLTLDSGEDGLSTAVVDPGGAFAYFGTSSSSVVKVRLSDFSRVGSLRLQPQNTLVTTAVIDPAGARAFFSTGNTASRVDLATFAVDASWTRAAGDGVITCSVLDPSGTFAYFAAPSALSTLYKVRLSDMTGQGELYKIGGLDWSTASVDSGGEFVYLGSFQGMTRVRLSDFSMGMTMSYGAQVGSASAAVVDTNLGQLLVAVSGSTNSIRRLKVPEFQWSGELLLRGGENRIHSAVVDSAAGFAYFGTDTSPGIIVKVRLSDFKRVAALTLEPGEDSLASAVLDPAGGFAYFGTSTDPGIVVKIRLSDFTRVAATTLGAGEGYLSAATIDAASGFAYFGTDTSPLPYGSAGLLVKVRLSDLARVGALNVTGGSGTVYTATPSVDGGFAYFGTASGGVASVIRVRLSDFSIADSLALPDFRYVISTLLVDPAAGRLYASSQGNPPILARVRLSDFARDGTLPFPDGQWIYSGVLDPATGYAYFASHQSAPASLVHRVRLSDFTLTAPLSVSEGWMMAGAIDPLGHFGYFGTEISPASIVKIDLRPALAPTATVAGGSADQSVCASSGSTLKAYLTGTPPWSVTWSDGATYTGIVTSPQTRWVYPTTTTTYTVTSMSDAGGPGSPAGSATVLVSPPTPTPVITAPASVFAGAAGIVASVPLHVGSSYMWGIQGGTLTSGASTNQVTFTANGPTTLSVQEANPCWSQQATAVVAVEPKPSTFRILDPCRLYDTREFDGSAAAYPPLAAGQLRPFFAVGHCSIPPGATAVSVNVTVTQPSASGSLLLYAADEPAPPSARTISFSAGKTRAANMLLRLPTDGSGLFRVLNDSAGTVHLILDVNGYFE